MKPQPSIECKHCKDVGFISNSKGTIPCPDCNPPDVEEEKERDDASKAVPRFNPVASVYSGGLPG